jgi:D-alanine-D-alanine ligase
MVPNEKKHLGVIFGGRSGEHEVSLMSARSVLEAVDRDKYAVTEIGITHDGVWMVGENVLEGMQNGPSDNLAASTLLPDPTRNGLFRVLEGDRSEALEHLVDLDVVFPVLHGTFGEDGTLQGLFELADLAYVGAGVLGSSVGMDKGVFKDVMRANDIPVVETLVLSRNEIEKDTEGTVERAMGLSPFPLFVKPANLGSSVGITKCTTRSDLYEGLIEAARYDRRILVERGVQARELEVSVLGNDSPAASVVGEVIPSREYYSYEAKYLDNTSKLLIPAPIPGKIADKVRELAVRAYKAIDCAGMARVDFLLEKMDASGREPGELYLNELNTIPGFTRISMYPKLWEASGLSFPGLVDRLIELAFERKAERDRTIRRFKRES